MGVEEALVTGQPVFWSQSEMRERAAGRGKSRPETLRQQVKHVGELKVLGEGGSSRVRVWNGECGHSLPFVRSGR